MSCCIKGRPKRGKSLISFFQNYDWAYESYLRVCGVGDELGDGFVPCCAGHLDGALQINLDNVGHHAYDPSGCWYGSPQITELWHRKMMVEIMKANVDKVID
mmetsp:Transcript_9276/g.13633  ORF Transcript_9276/g.13633 Transcript_9276/m.13633 type:complete len:102 (+) Transcript_9276:120-425(+)